MSRVNCAFVPPAFPVTPRPSFFVNRRRSERTRYVAAVSRRVRATVAPEGQVAVVEIGYGTDLHGQDATAAAVRACRHAIEFNSLPGLSRLTPNGNLSEITVHVKLGVPAPFGKDIDEKRILEQFPYGKVVVEVVDGGLCCGSGIVLPEKGDASGDDRAIVVVAAVSVFC